MNLREKYINSVRRYDNIYVPYYFELTPFQVEKFYSIYRRYDYEEFFEFPVRILRLKYIGEDPKVKYKKYLGRWENNTNLIIGSFGNVSIKASDSHFAHFEAIMDEFDKIEDFENYPYPDAILDFDWDGFYKQVEYFHKKGLAVEGSWI